MKTETLNTLIAQMENGIRMITNGLASNDISMATDHLEKSIELKREIAVQRATYELNCEEALFEDSTQYMQQLFIKASEMLSSLRTLTRRMIQEGFWQPSFG